MKPEYREIQFDNLREIAKRIIDAKHYLFAGKPYASDMKANKEITFNKLCKMQDENIKQVGQLFSKNS